VLQLLDLFAGLVQPLQHQPCGFQVDPADFGQQDPPRAALEQSRTEFRLQVIDRFGQGRRVLPSCSAARLKLPSCAVTTNIFSAPNLSMLFPFRQKRFS
jgi:hypothetical protein